jgi:peptidyl-prolyl cis-trans isomerase D
MITWMQRHKKYLIITMWVSTIAFIGAGFVGWGQYSYGDKATAIAKVGDVSITSAELNRGYSRLYAQYAQIFQGNFDEEKAKQFGLQKQAIRQLIDQALILNLAQSYNIRVNDEELLENIKTQQSFFNNGVFDKDVYQKTLKQNRLSIKEYENDVRKSMIIEKVLNIFQPSALPLEKELLSSAQNIQDKLKYNVLDANMVTIDESQEKLKAYWEQSKSNYMTLPSYKMSLIRQESVSSEPSDDAIKSYYAEHKHDFKGSDGAILELEAARISVIQALDEKATKKAALKKYIAFKKGKLDDSVVVEQIAIDSASNLVTPEVFKEITQLTTTKPFLKPRKVGATFMILKLDEVIASTEKTFEQAQEDVARAYKTAETARLLQELATSTLKEFDGRQTDFITRNDVSSVEGLSPEEASEFLNTVFDKQDKQGYVVLSDEKIVQYNILEQRLLNTPITDEDNKVMQIKNALLNRGLIQSLESKYPVEMFVKGL